MLFQSPENEITGIKLPERSQLVSFGTTLINSRVEHRKVLQGCFNQVRKRLVIVSPFISDNAIVGNNIAKLMQTISTHVEVMVYTDKFLNSKNRFQRHTFELKPRAEKGINLLQNLSIQVHFVKNVHSKIICIDNSTFIEGSYNWLSAVVDDDSPFANHEASIVYRDSKVANYISRIMEDMKSRLIE